MENNENLKIPKHVSIIMDGNGRWAKQRKRPRTYGHTVGAENVMKIVEEADEIGIRYLTVYAFSTENWSRPETEVKTLMFLFQKYVRICQKKAMENNACVRVIGDKTGLNQKLRESIEELERVTADNTGIHFQIAINYGSRDEMIRAMKRMMNDCRDGKFRPEDLTEERFSSYLDTAGIPDPDLMIRTSGEERLSNWLMWQHAYSEFVFTDVAWPDFHKQELLDCIREYTKRDRRFGKIEE